MRDILRLSLPLTLWLISFSGLYGLQAVLCALDWSHESVLAGLTWGRILLLAAAAAAVLAQALVLCLLAASRFAVPPGFVRSTSIALATVALVATIWTAMPVFTLTMCQA